MEYEGYLTQEEVLERVEKAFPFVERPLDDELYLFDERDLMRTLISPKLSKFTEPELPYDGVMLLYDEFSSITHQAVKWMFPSMLRIIIKNRDASGNLHWYLPTYFEKVDFNGSNSAYNFSWLSVEQLSALNCVFEYISEKYGESISYAQETLRELEQKI
ncbi:hypothetical protein E4634_21005 [Mangrovimicrobium sediminis]|uniref:Uncharacterized protein n=1 Tax=Mangrovimicrobium sediminis TaxID=2562682 RepID=A0A4Z0LTG1_9GAMM|nr:hypothetical protein [Haliea sp. SAOS-164]TGD70529.1 hypothetical protein E4634_21005 [Haliea sp. SAOS-164]